MGPKHQGRWGGPLLVALTSFLTSFVPTCLGPPTSLAFVFSPLAVSVLCFFFLLYLSSSFLFQKKRREI